MSNPIKPNFKSEAVPLILIIVSLVTSVYFYRNFPDQVPIHWDLNGNVDSWGSKKIGAFLIPLVMMGMYLLFLGLPYIDPKKERYIQFRKPYNVIKGIIVAYMAIIYFITSLSGLGYNIKIDLWITLMIGVLFMIIGNYLSKIKSNWFIGIRTPWTLSNEEVWNKTHRFSGKLFFLGGLIICLLNFFNSRWKMTGLLVIVFGIVILTIGYSYFAFAKNQKQNKNS